MEDQDFDQTKQAVLAHIEKLFAEMEEEIAISHQEKLALLEDSFEQASDADELKVAFDQWYSDHSEDIGFEHECDDLWDQALHPEDDDEPSLAFRDPADDDEDFEDDDEDFS